MVITGTTSIEDIEAQIALNKDYIEALAYHVEYLQTQWYEAQHAFRLAEGKLATAKGEQVKLNKILESKNV